MNCRSNETGSSQRVALKSQRIALRIGNVRASAFYSSKDECWVTAVKCSKCGRVYHERLDYAEALVVQGMPFFCISCEGGTADVTVRPLTLAGFLAITT